MVTVENLKKVALELEKNSKNVGMGIIAATEEVWRDTIDIKQYNAGNVILGKLNRMGRFKWTR